MGSVYKLRKNNHVGRGKLKPNPTRGDRDDRDPASRIIPELDHHGVAVSCIGLPVENDGLMAGFPEEIEAPGEELVHD